MHDDDRVRAQRKSSTCKSCPVIDVHAIQCSFAFSVEMMVFALQSNIDYNHPSQRTNRIHSNQTRLYCNHPGQKTNCIPSNQTTIQTKQCCSYLALTGRIVTTWSNQAYVVLAMPTNRRKKIILSPPYSIAAILLLLYNCRYSSRFVIPTTHHLRYFGPRHHFPSISVDKGKKKLEAEKQRTYLGGNQ